MKESPKKSFYFSKIAKKKNKKWHHKKLIFWFSICKITEKIDQNVNLQLEMREKNQNNLHEHQKIIEKAVKKG